MFALSDTMITIEDFRGLIIEYPYSINGNVKHKNWEEINPDLQINISDTDKAYLTGSLYSDSMDISVEIKNLNIDLFFQY